MKGFKFTVASLLLFMALPASAQLLYKVEGKNLKEPSYVFGTHHLAPVTVVEKVGALAPFEAASQVVGEIDMTQDQMALAMSMQPHMIAPTDSTLSKVISAEDFTIINEEFKKWAPAPGLELGMLDSMKPMVITSMVAVGMSAQAMPDYDPSQQLDSWFQENGKSKGKTIIPLETAEEQATILFDNTPISYQAEALVEMLKNPQEAIDNSVKLTELYNLQDVDGMLNLSYQEDAHPEFMTALLDNRNANWLKLLPAIFEKGSSFVAVGALHLPGEKGIIEGLRKQGYTVSPIK